MTIDKRKIKILQAIIDDYINTGEPLDPGVIVISTMHSGFPSKSTPGCVAVVPRLKIGILFFLSDIPSGYPTIVTSSINLSFSKINEQNINQFAEDIKQKI